MGRTQTHLMADHLNVIPGYQVNVIQRIILVIGVVGVTFTWASSHLALALLSLDFLAITIGVGAYITAKRVVDRYSRAVSITLGMAPTILGGNHAKVSLVLGEPVNPIWLGFILIGMLLTTAPMIYVITGMIKTAAEEKSATLAVHHLADLSILVIASFGALMVLQFVPIVQSGQSVWTAFLLVSCNVGLVALGTGLFLGRSQIPYMQWGLVVTIAIALVSDIWIAQFAISGNGRTWIVTAAQALICLPLIVAFTLGNPHYGFRPSFMLEPTNVVRAGGIGLSVVLFLALPFMVNLGIPVPVWGIFVSSVMSLLAVRMWTLIWERDNNLRQRKVYELSLRHRIQHDPLTDLWSRSVMASRFEALGVTISRPAVLVYVRVLRLDEVRETLGHDYGDEAIRIIANLLKTHVNGQGDVFRFRREEFVVIYTPPANLTEVYKNLNEIRTMVDSSTYSDGHDLNVSVHIGMVPIETTRDLEDGIRWCEVAADEVKDTRSMVLVVQETHIDQVAEITVTDQRLREALRNELFSLKMLPVMDTINHSCVGFEAVARWTGYDTPPTTFVRSLEQVGLADVFGRWVLEEATAFAAEVGCPISVNVSISHIQNSSFVQDIKRALDASALHPERLTIEFSEHELAANPDRVVDSLSQVRDLGVRIALDDLGTGGLTLAQISRLPIEIIKIDPSVISKAMRYQDSRQLLQTITEASTNLGLVLMAEGIETNDALNLIIDSGCTTAQGFLWTKPLDIVDARHWWQFLGTAARGTV